MKRKRLLMLVGSICLAVMLAVIAGSADKTMVVAKDDKVKKKAIEWVGQTDFGAEYPAFASAQRMCEAITTASHGLLRLTVEPAADPSATFNRVDEGDIDFAVSWSLYWTDKFPAAGLFCIRAGGMSPMAKYLWFISGGGAELAQQMIDDQDYNVHVVPGGGYLGTPCLFLHSKYPVKSVADLQGLEEIRCGGDDAAEILSEMGASVIWLPGDEIYDAMQCTEEMKEREECIDAFTYDSPYIHWQMSFQEVADYVYVSGCRDSHVLAHFIVNETSWNELPDDLKAIVLKVSKEEVLTSYDERRQLDIEALAKFWDYGCTVEMLSSAIEEAFLTEASEYYSEKATTEGGFYAKVIRSLRAFEAITSYDEQCQGIYCWGD